MSGNRNPHLRWTGVPSTARSLVLLCVDVDVPTRADDVNKEGRMVPADLPRTNFWHWVMVDIPPPVSEIPAGSALGRRSRRAASATRAGRRARARDSTITRCGLPAMPDMAGKYFGYDGPCPPWNDALLHHYHFTLYATDLARCPVDGEFTGQQVQDAIAQHVLAEARLTGTYSAQSCGEVKRRAQRAAWTSSSSTSKTSVAPGGITPPAPLGP